MNKKKLATSVAAVATAAALLLGGTFAWQSANQTALNEASDVINPGGRLHDDFYIDDRGNYNSDIYVENFADDEIFARVKLQEYMEIVINQGVAGAEVVETVAGSKTLHDAPAAEVPTDNTSGYEYAYVTHYFDQSNVTEDYWKWTPGAEDSAEVWYMPTFNMNKDSLVADRNGMYVDRIGGISNRGQGQYEEWTVWNEGDTQDGTEIYDIDPNRNDEVGYDFENLQTYVDAENIKTVAQTHTAVPVGETKGLISMSQWLEKLDNGEEIADYWVYDEDGSGWVYWSSPIAAKSTTGLLLDGIELKQVMDDTWYYAIEAVGQFVTANDAGKGDGTGFYDETVSGNTAPSADAERLLTTIGVTLDGSEEEEEGPVAFRIYDAYTDEGVDYREGETAYLGAGDYTLFVSSGDGGLYTGENPDDFIWSVSPEIAYTENEVHNNGEEGYYYVSVDFTLDETVAEGEEFIFTATNGTDDFEMVASVVYSPSDDEGYYGDGVITVNGYGANDAGYIYLSGLDIEQDNSFAVEVRGDFELAENGLTAQFHEDDIVGTEMVVSDTDPYSATLTIAARDHHSVEITAEDVYGERETVTVVPVYQTILITPDMDGETLTLPSGYYSLRAEDFDPAEVTFTLSGAKRSDLVEDNGEQKLSLTSYESGTNIVLTTSNGEETVNVNIEVADANPYDGPLYSYYIQGVGDTWAYSLVETQDYAWEQNDGYTYKLYAGMTNDFAGAIAWKITGNTEADTVYFVNGDDATGLTYTGFSPEIKFTAEQTAPFTILVDIYADEEKSVHMTDGEGNAYDSNSQYFTIFPTKSGNPVIRHMSVHWEGEAVGSAYPDPGETMEVHFLADIRREGQSITNADVTWSLEEVESGCTFTIEEGAADSNTAIVTHTCPVDECTRIGAVQAVVSYDHAYGQKGTSEFYIVSKDYEGDIDLGVEGGDEGGEDAPESTLAMTFVSSPAYTEQEGSAYITIEKIRGEEIVWNLYGCSEEFFTLTSSNGAVTFAPFGGVEANQNFDMDIIIPTAVTEDFTVTATSMDGTKTVTFFIVMSEDLVDTEE
ncbi:MAG: hypothetical protein IJA33_02820 [Oscillospiraceae bacterium]|nr:hypothetical protein [Oscillospiraceae bacterium]